MKTFLDTTDKSFTFSSCDGCPSKCCDGKEGTIFSQLILDDFEVVAKNFPILFTFGEMGYLKANILFSDGKSFCPYITNHQCTIYNERPSICRVYPLSPNLDNKVYIDDSCPAINTKLGQSIVKNGQATNNFNYPTLENYQDKFINTHLHLEQFNDKKNFEKVIIINSVEFYKYIGTKSDFYLDLHLLSLNYLDRYK
ncbi:MAG: YkgJ family cysteine cluster protein [Campylobacterota bacterium]|nr:YkgJ family cysteine cluster protein [Campylobacterota bacterium]